MISTGMSMIWKGIKSFLLFWIDFIIGDSPEIAVGVVIILGISVAINRSELASAIVVPGLVVTLLIFSVWRGRNK